MTKPARGLPDNFALDLPDEDQPVVIGDFLDEAPVVHVVKKAPRSEEPVPVERPVPEAPFIPQIVPDSTDEERGENQSRAFSRKQHPSKVIRYQLNLTPKSKTMFEELIEHVRTYSPENDARTSEVFQGVIGLLHSAMNELELSELPRRGAWGSVTARNFPGALSESFEKAILRSAKKRGMVG